MSLLIAIAEVTFFLTAAFGALVLLWVLILVTFGGEFHFVAQPRRRPQVTRIGGRRLTCPRCGATGVVPDDARDLTEGDAR